MYVAQDLSFYIISFSKIREKYLPGLFCLAPCSFVMPSPPPLSENRKEQTVRSELLIN